MEGGLSQEEKEDRARRARERLRQRSAAREYEAYRGGRRVSPVRDGRRGTFEDDGFWSETTPEPDGAVPPIVTDPEEAPDGPPWHYDLTDEERAAREEKRENRQARMGALKQKALDKTPKRLKAPSDLQVRFRTGVVYTGLTIACILLGALPMTLMLMLVAGICAGEFYYMLRQDAKLPNETLGIIAAVLYPLSVYLAGLTGAMVVCLALLLALIIWYVFWLRARIPDVGVSFFGAAYTGLLLSGLVIIRKGLDDPWGGIVVLIIFLSVWGNDAFAYLVGSKIGRHKLAPRTSPKKSWEGFIAGLVGSALIWMVISFVPGVSMPLWMAALFGIAVGAMGVLGDLAESRIKRNSGVKDSGTIMPGHGGLLDRSDSLFTASMTAAVLMVACGCLPNIVI